jgi:putative hemolysin
MSEQIPMKAGEPWRLGVFRDRDDLVTRWNADDVLLVPNVGNALYDVGFACSDRALQAAQRLRFEVFNVELKEGLFASWQTGRDEDPFDRQMSHLVLIQKATGRVIGTYRLQTQEQTFAGGLGYYSESEFDLTQLRPLLPHAVELGRACILDGHRSFGTVLMLWKGIRAFLERFGKTTLFGCCSLTSIDPDDGWRAMRTLRRKGALHPSLHLEPLPACSCGPASRETDGSIAEELELPKLFSAYLRLGAQVISAPALDREFGTVDFLILLDAREVSMSALEGIR